MVILPLDSLSMNVIISTTNTMLACTVFKVVIVSHLVMNIAAPLSMIYNAISIEFVSFSYSWIKPHH